MKIGKLRTKNPPTNINPIVPTVAETSPYRTFGTAAPRNNPIDSAAYRKKKKNHLI